VVGDVDDLATRGGGVADVAQAEFGADVTHAHRTVFGRPRVERSHEDHTVGIGPSEEFLVRLAKQRLIERLAGLNVTADALVPKSAVLLVVTAALEQDATTLVHEQKLHRSGGESLRLRVAASHRAHHHAPRVVDVQEFVDLVAHGFGCRSLR
jgi:hypothetical protein